MWFQGQKYFAAGLGEETEPRGLPVFEEAKRWLDLYLSLIHILFVNSWSVGMVEERNPGLKLSEFGRS